MAEVAIVTDPAGATPPVPPVADSKRPTWLPEKFKTPEEMATAYGELEKKQSTAPALAPTLDASKVDMPALTKEFAENGKLSEETLKGLEAKGFTREAVGVYTSALEAKSTAQRAELVSVVGSEENLKTLYDWSAANLSAKELEFYNTSVNSGNMDAAKLALHGIISRYNDAVGRDPQLVSGENIPAASGAKPFGSQGAVVAAMRDPRYESDPDYRAEVAQRLNVTKAFSTYR